MRECVYVRVCPLTHSAVLGSGGYLCTNSLRASIAAWLDASQRSRDIHPLNRSVREV